MRNIEFINNEWLFKGDFNPTYLEKECNLEGFEVVELPHTNKVLPYNYLNEEDYQFISCYVKKLTVVEEFRGKRVFLDFEGVMTAAKVYCNGAFVCEHKGGYTFFEAELTNHLCYGEENTVVVEVDSYEHNDIPPFGNVVDYLTYGGIYREVSLRVVENTYIKHTFIKGNDCLEDKKKLEVEIVVAGDATAAAFDVVLQDGEAIIARQKVQKDVVVDNEKIIVRFEELENITLWDIHEPKRYEVIVSYENSAVLVDQVSEYIGFRHATFKPEGFFLNGRLVKIIGLNRHQAYPYVGYAMPKRVQEKDADILKYEMGLNLVRTSHYPQSKHFLNRCDEIGLLVFEEIPGWQHIGDEAWQEISIQNVREMIVRDFNHPSIILWGVRINESQDNHDFYTKTNAVAHELDVTRQTGGVRYSQKSELLEDVYTFNDFVHSGNNEVLRQRDEVTGLEHPVPLLVTESNGHMYPTKRIDHESKLVEHASRHLRVVNEALGRDDITGSISWCAFDYNTHASFGSGDKICYHGVSDMFRIPKYAAFSYASQKYVEEGIVLEVASLTSRGERDGGGIVPFNVLTNCDYIKLYKNGEFVDTFYPESEVYPHLQHPPIMITHLMPESLDLGITAEDMAELKGFVIGKIKEGTLIDMTQADFGYVYQLAIKNNVDVRTLVGGMIKGAGGWGDVANTLTIEGYVNGELVVTRKVGEVKHMAELIVTADDEVLQAHEVSYDATRIEIKVVDTLGQMMPFSNEIAIVEIEGPAKIMGPCQFALQGGASACWIRTVGESGTVKVHVKSMYFEKTIQLEVK